MPRNKKAEPNSSAFMFVVELRGVEPLSEKLKAATSTYLADCYCSLKAGQTANLPIGKPLVLQSVPRRSRLPCSAWFCRSGIAELPVRHSAMC